MNHIISQNIDRDENMLRANLQRLVNEPGKYVALLIQDCPKTSSPQTEQLLRSTTANNLTVYSANLIDNKDENLSNRLVTILDTKLCTASQHVQVGNAKAASLIVHIKLLNRPAIYYLANTYIKPKQLLQEITNTIDQKTSRLISAGDLNAS